jgi:hypothetical protein
VDIETCSAGGYNIGWTDGGEWLEYTVNVSKPAYYDIQVYVASPEGSSIHVNFDGADITGSLAIPATGGWQQWQPITRTDVIFKAGMHYLQLYEENGGFNIDKMILVYKSPLTPDGDQHGSTYFQIYPNPASSSINIAFESAASAPVKIEIYDLQGRRVQSLDAMSDSGINQLALDVSHLTSGNYYITVIRNNTTKTNKLLVIK